MVRYLETVIIQSINEVDVLDPNVPPQRTSPQRPTVPQTLNFMINCFLIAITSLARNNFIQRDTLRHVLNTSETDPVKPLVILICRIKSFPSQQSTIWK